MTLPVVFEANFSAWRAAARQQLLAGRAPDAIAWIEAGERQGLLDFGAAPGEGPGAGVPAGVPADAAGAAAWGDEARGAGAAATVHVPRAFVEAATLAAVHREPRRWQVLYRILWRLAHGEPHLLEVEVDDDVLLLRSMAKAVGRDIHKMHAFVRFRKAVGLDPEDPEAAVYIAWHCPDHAIVELAAPFFARRFRTMTWSILTPDGSAFWDQEALTYGPGVPLAAAPRLQDDLETLWRSYYGAIFNPARIKLKTMKREMPVRHWRTLPEASMIDELLAGSEARVAAMLQSQPTSAAPFVPAAASDLAALRAAAERCRGCQLCEHATQVVFGDGPQQARIVCVGEQPGDQEDLAGSPFVGPAGEVLSAALAAAGLERSQLYLTNAVKHFKHEQQGKLRLHKRPEARDVAACKPWLTAELQMIKPQILVCLGLTAAHAVLGRVVRLKDERGRWQASGWTPQTLVTTHPAAILRTPDAAARAEAMAHFVADLRLVAAAHAALVSGAQLA